MINKILHSEKIFVLLLAFAAMIFNLFPYIYAAKVAPHDKVFVGSYPIIYDKPTYLAEMAQGEEGNWKMINMYTTEEQKPVFLYPLYLGMGHISRITHVSIENVFLIGRFFFGTILLITVLYFIRYFVPDTNQRKLAYFLALFATGVGWLNLNIKSIDNWIPDAIPIIRFSYFPHIMLANILFLAAIFLIWIFLKNNDTKTTIAAGLTLFVLNIILPFQSLFIYALTLTYIFIGHITKSINAKGSIKNIIIFLIVSAPSLVYMILLGMVNPVWKIVEQQNILETPNIPDILTGYGLVLLFSIPGFLVLFKKNYSVALLMFLWVLNVFILSHIPITLYPMQRRFLETVVYVPLAISAAYGIVAIYEHLKQKQVKNLSTKVFFFSAFILFPALLAGNMHIWYNRFDQYIKATDNPSMYLPKNNIDAMEWIKQNTPKNSIILGSVYNSNIAPYYAARKVFVGQGAMTLNFNDKLDKTENFYSGKYTPEEMIEFLSKEKINYILFSNEEKISAVERKQLPDFAPEHYPFFKNVFQNTGIKIYQFINYK